MPIPIAPIPGAVAGAVAGAEVAKWGKDAFEQANQMAKTAKEAKQNGGLGSLVRDWLILVAVNGTLLVMLVLGVVFIVRSR